MERRRTHRRRSGSGRVPRSESPWRFNGRLRRPWLRRPHGRQQSAFTRRPPPMRQTGLTDIGGRFPLSEPCERPPVAESGARVKEPPLAATADSRQRGEKFRSAGGGLSFKGPAAGREHTRQLPGADLGCPGPPLARRVGQDKEARTALAGMPPPPSALRTFRFLSSSCLFPPPDTLIPLGPLMRCYDGRISSSAAASARFCSPCRGTPARRK